VSSNASSRHIWEITRRHCEQRILFGKPLSKLQVTQFKLVDMLTRITADRELVHSCIRKRMRAEDATLEISMAKLVVGRTSRYVADECIQLHGGMGYMTESAAGRAFVDSRLISIGGGADETMIHYMAKMIGL
jgi:citronellyl-CoA dehydrogenase